ncbi:hypothetical protein [Nitrosomonas sp.]|nr:hypothetical protein [Nitrosomonas sp.]
MARITFDDFVDGDGYVLDELQYTVTAVPTIVFCRVKRHKTIA